MTTRQAPGDQSPEPLAGPARRLRRRLTWAALAACLAGASALGLATPGQAGAATRTAAANPPASIIRLSGTGQTTTTRSPWAAPLRVQVYDDSGHPVAGVTVTFTISTGYAGMTGTAAFRDGAQSADATTGTDGVAASPALTAGTDVGWLRVTASMPGLSSVYFDLRVDYSPAAQVTIVSGDAQSALVGTGFAHPLVVQVLDAHGYPVVDGSTVTFQIEGSGPSPGTATFANGQTTATVGINAGTGYATSPALTGGNTPGTFRVRAYVPQGPIQPEADFTGTTLPQAATTIEVAGGNYQFGSANSLFPTQLKVRLLDQAGNPLSLQNAHVTVTGPAILYGHTSVDVQGTQSISMPLAATDDSGPVTVTVTSGNASATFREYVVPGRGAVTISPLRGDGQHTSSGKPFPAQLGVLVQDGDSRVIPGFPVTFTADGPAVFADGSKSATVTSAASGVTYAPDLHATTASGPVTVTVAIAGSDASAVFHLTVDAPAFDHLVIVAGDKQTAQANSIPVPHVNPLKPFPAPLTVQAIGADGKPVKGVRVDYTVQGPAGFDLLGNVTGNLLDNAAYGYTGADGQYGIDLYPGINMTGAVTVTATTSGFGSVTFTETVVSR
jgi:hypothetical protein